jgi:uncharacterized protein (DUF433 family)
MIEMPTAISVPLTRDEQGNIRVGNTRVLLELVIYAFQQGETAEEIVDSYSTLTLGDVYAVIAYYLSHQAEVAAYMREAEEKADRIQREVEANYSPQTHALLNRLRALRNDNAVSLG